MASVQKGFVQQVRCTQADLDYAHFRDEVLPWTKLDSAPPIAGASVPKFAISLVNFDYGLQFVQSRADKKGNCSVRYSVGDYGTCAFSKKDDRTAQMLFTPEGIPEITFDDNARDLPLAKLFINDRKDIRIRLTMNLNSFKPNLVNVENVISKLTHLTTGSSTRSDDTPEGEFIVGTKQVSLAEAKAQAALIAKGHDCTIKTRSYKELVVLEIWPGIKVQDNIEDEEGSKQFGQRYKIGPDSKIFPDKESYENRVPGSEEEGWQITIVNSLPHFSTEAPMIGILLNRFRTPSESRTKVGREETGLDLHPIIEDILGERSRDALQDFADDLDALGKETAGFLKKKTTPSNLPMRAMWVPGMAYSSADNTLPEADFPDSTAWRGTMNDQQVNAVKTAFNNKLSVIWGPAATGKSEVLSKVVLLAARKPERILVTGSTNVAVDNLLKRCVVEHAKLQKQKSPVFHPIRLFSQSQIEAQYIAEDPRLQDPHHIEAQRLKLAEQLKWVIFLRGRQFLMQDGCIESSEVAKDYRAQARALTKMVMLKATAVFCTTAAVRSQALYWTEKTNKDDLEATIKTWAPTINIMDEAACATPLDLLLPMATFGDSLRRVIWAGDQMQLPAFIISELGLQRWRTSPFEQMQTKGWPTTQLVVQYRTHDGLNDAPNTIIYDGKLQSFYKTQNPRPVLQRLNGILPIAIVHEGNKYQVPSYLNFINVADSRQEGPEKGSKFNMGEIKMIVATIRRFHELGMFEGQLMSLEHIGIITGYALQYAKLRNFFDGLHKVEPTFGWNLVKICTSGKVQGDEFEIVLVSLVKSQGSRGFLGGKQRANVVTTRAREAMYYFGNWGFWGNSKAGGLHYLDDILWRSKNTSGKTRERPEFVIDGQRWGETSSPDQEQIVTLSNRRSTITHSRQPSITTDKEAAKKTLLDELDQEAIAEKAAADQEHIRINERLAIRLAEIAEKKRKIETSP